MRKFILILLIFHSFSSGFAQNETFTNMLSEINGDSIKRTVMDMQAFPSRFCLHNNKKAAEYLVERLHQYGIDNAAIDSFYVDDSTKITGKFEAWMYNVKGSISGNEHPDSTVIIGAHLDAIVYDTINFLYNITTGADDNASGVATMIEMARIFHKYNIKPRLSVDFMGFDAEELGLHGSRYDAEKRHQQQEKIAVMLNNDMVGHQPEEQDWMVFISVYFNSSDIMQTTEAICHKFTRLYAFIPGSSGNKYFNRSDSYSYFSKGYKVNYLREYRFSPYYHSMNDIYQNCNFEYMKEIAKINFGLLYHYAIDSLEVNNISEASPILSGANIYPNPAADNSRLQFVLLQASTVDIRITDLSGKTIIKITEKHYNEGRNTVELNAQALSPGIYFCVIGTPSGNKTLKWIIQ
ncbi:MAG: M28 family peptidase [Bacteroidales bacterium]|nr:M28 family peptidase [Bacteroidales bacterium]